MKFLAINQLSKKTLDTFIRFPFAILVSFLGVFICFRLIDLSWDNGLSHDHLYHALMVCSLGLPLFVAITLYLERAGSNLVTKVIAQVIATLLLGLYYYCLKDHFLVDDLVRFWVLNLGFHLCVAFAAFTQKNQVNGFWQFNKTLFLRAITSALYTCVLYGGLSLALVSIDKLLGVNIHEKNYFRLWIFLAGVFNTWFFLSGVPKDFEELETLDTYPKGLKIFTQYVLLPLVTVYLSILYLYIFKILINLSLPHGWVSVLIISFSTVGILSLLLIHPISKIEENKWMSRYSKWFYIALLPLLLLMYLAIFKRIIDYGITEDRYYILLLALWLTFIDFYFNFSRKKSIKVIPISLALVCFISSYGPWSATTISVHSQYGRMITILKQNNLYMNGKIIQTTKEINKQDEENIISISDYLVNTHGIVAIQPLFKDDLDSLLNNKGRGSSSRYMDTWKVDELIRKRYLSVVAQEVSFDYSLTNVDESIKKRAYFTVDSKDANIAENIKGFDYSFEFNEYQDAYSKKLEKIVDIINENKEKTSFKIMVNEPKGCVSIADDSGEKCVFNFNDFISKATIDSSNDSFYINMDSEKRVVVQESPKYSMALIIKNLTLAIGDSSKYVENIGATGLIHVK